MPVSNTPVNLSCFTMEGFTLSRQADIAESIRAMRRTWAVTLFGIYDIYELQYSALLLYYSAMYF